MSIETELSLNSKPFEQKLKESEAQVTSSASKMNKSLKNVGGGSKNSAVESLDKFGDSADKAVTALDSLSGAFGGASTGLSGFAGDLINLAKSPVTMVIAALGTLVSVSIAVWDKLSLSAEEYAHKLAIVSDEATKARQDLEKEQSESLNYMNRLEELSKKELDSNESKKEAAYLIDLLTKKYGDLGLSINETSNSIEGFDLALQKMIAKQTQERLQALQKEYDAMQRQGQNQAEVSLNSTLPVSVISKYFNSAGDAVKAIQDFMKNNSIEEQIKLFETLRDMMGTQEDIDAMQKMIDLKRKQLSVEHQIKALRESGYASEAEAARKLAEATKKSKEAEANRIKEQREKQQEQDRFSSAEKVDEQLKLYQEEYNKNQKELDDYTSKLEELKKRRQELLDANKNDPQAERYVQRYLDPEIADLNIKVEKGKTGQYELQKKISSLEKQSENFYKNSIESLDSQIQLATLLLQGKDDEIEKQKIINQLKEKGLKVDEAEINKILEKQKELGKIKFNQEVLNDLNDLEYQAEKKFGNARKADLDKQKKEYEKQKGSKLTKEEEERIEKLFNLQTKLNSFPQLNLQGLDIQTNSLTSRGGFKTGAVESNTDRINTQIMNYSKAQTDLLNQIKAEISKLKKI